MWALLTASTAFDDAEETELMKALETMVSRLDKLDIEHGDDYESEVSEYEG